MSSLLMWKCNKTWLLKLSRMCMPIFLPYQSRFKKFDSNKHNKKHLQDEKYGRIHFPHYKFYTADKAGSFVKSLNNIERQNLFNELQKYELESFLKNSSEANGSSTAITSSQLKLLFVYNCAPFIGFGFLDNAIMILAGEYIDLTIGFTLGISTMAAAALGNMISDLAGLGLAGYVEILCGKMGLPMPDLTAQQMEQRSCRFSSYLGKVIGVVIGCLIGMFPLLFLNERKNSKESNEDAVQKN